MTHILVIEDNNDYRELLKNFLESDGYTVMTATDGADGLTHIKQHNFDLVLLDLMLPQIDGYYVCEMIRRVSQVPIIMLTALYGEEHQIRGFDLQIDDYITKPVSMRILLHKVAAILRRTHQPDTEYLTYGNISLDLKGYAVTIAGNAVDFTLKEFEILLELMRVPGQVVSRNAILSKLWNYNFYGDARIVDTHIKNIRKKLDNDDCIETVRGVGYKLSKRV